MRNKRQKPGNSTASKSSLVKNRFLLVIANLMVLTSACVKAGQQAIVEGSNYDKNTQHADQIRKSVTVLITKTNGQAIGSGVLVEKKKKGYWVATNRHVVGEQNEVCIVTSSSKSTISLVEPPTESEIGKAIDLAFVWLPAEETDTINLANLKEGKSTAEDLPVVISTGYPIAVAGMDNPEYSERSGLLVPLLKAPIEDELDLTYTATVDKGMSGGGVFIGSELIGINSAHRDPLWQGRWLDANGNEVNQHLNKKLDQVSLGISINKVRENLKNLTIPSQTKISGMEEKQCSLKNEKR